LCNHSTRQQVSNPRIPSPHKPPIDIFDKLPDYHLNYYRILPAMSTLLTRKARSCSFKYGISNTHTDCPTTNTFYGDSNANVGNVSNSYNNTINVGIDEETSRIYEWLSPLEPHKRHQDVRNRRLDGVGEWVLHRSEFESWRKSQDGLENSTLLCYGGQGVGKTYIR